jgi:uncharacterized membrane protein
MKRKGILLMCLVLFLQIIFTQKAIHQYFYQEYWNTILFAGLNVVMFPVAGFIYKRDKRLVRKQRNEAS